MFVVVVIEHDDDDSAVFYWHVTICFLSQGNKKGPLGRWDFDTQEEYSDYMNNKEALPKYVARCVPQL